MVKMQLEGVSKKIDTPSLIFLGKFIEVVFIFLEELPAIHWLNHLH